MIALSERYGLGYVGIPKCGTAAMLHVMYEIENDRTFDAEPESPFIHDFYRARMDRAGIGLHPPELDKIGGYWLFAVVRDPIARLLSAYAHRVAMQGHIGRAWCAAGAQKRDVMARAGLEPAPSPAGFFARLTEYRRHFPSIAHHTDPVSRFLGPDLGRYGYVGRLEEMGGVARMLRQRLGRCVEITPRHVSSPAAAFGDLPGAVRQALLRFTEPDYVLLRDYYEAPAA